jgi:chromosome partitioning protein
MQMRSIAVINQKGGVGKTTITTNLGHALAMRGQQVTLLDLDPQGHLAASLGIFRAPARGVADLMLGECRLDAVAIRSREHLTLVPSGRRLTELEQMQEGGANRARMLKKALNGSLEGQDFVLIDCPPSAGLLVANAVLSADEVLVPVTGDYLGLNGLAQLMQTLKGFQPFRQRPLKHWIELSRFMPRRRLSREVNEKLQQHFPGKLLGTPINEAAVLAECPGAGRSIFEYRSASRSAKEFEMLADELMQTRTQ